MLSRFENREIVMLLKINTISRLIGWKSGGIFHVGAHKFEEIDDYQLLGFNPVIWFDPQDQYLPKKLPPDNYFHKCVIQDSDDSIVTFNYYKDATGFSSIYQVNTQVSKFFTSMPQSPQIISVTSERLRFFQRAYLNKYQNQTWTLIISTQGSEVSVLRSADLDSIDQVAILTSKKEIYTDAGNSFEESSKILRQFSFNLNLDVSDPIFGHGWQYWSKANDRNYRIHRLAANTRWFLHWLYAMSFRIIQSIEYRLRK